MANAAIQSLIESLLRSKLEHDTTKEFVIIVGKGKGSKDTLVLLPTVQNLLGRVYKITGQVDAANADHLGVKSKELQYFVLPKQWQL
jgi:hypothetical protein